MGSTDGKYLSMLYIFYDYFELVPARRSCQGGVCIFKNYQSQRFTRDFKNNPELCRTYFIHLLLSVSIHVDIVICEIQNCVLVANYAGKIIANYAGKIIANYGGNNPNRCIFHCGQNHRELWGQIIRELFSHRKKYFLWGLNPRPRD